MQAQRVLHFSASLIKEIDAPVPSSFTLSLNGMDGLEDMDVVDTNTTRSDKYLTLDVMSGLPRHRLWNCTVKPYRCQNNQIRVEGSTELSELYYPCHSNIIILLL